MTPLRRGFHPPPERKRESYFIRNAPENGLAICCNHEIERPKFYGTLFDAELFVFIEITQNRYLTQPTEAE